MPVVTQMLLGLSSIIKGMYQQDFVKFHLRKPKVGRKQSWIKTYRYFQSDLLLQSWKWIRRQLYFFNNFRPPPLCNVALWIKWQLEAFVLDNIVLGGGGTCSWWLGIGGQNLNNWFQRMVKFYPFLKKSMEFISMIVVFWFKRFWWPRKVTSITISCHSQHVPRPVSCLRHLYFYITFRG